MPASKSVTLELRCKINEKIKTRAPAPKPPIKANIETGLRYLKVKNEVKGSNPETRAPKVAPAEMPRIPESAKGFLKNPWKTAPAPPSNAPHKMQSRILGRRISNRITLSKRLRFPCKNASIEIFCAPIKRAIAIERMRHTINKRYLPALFIEN